MNEIFSVILECLDALFWEESKLGALPRGYLISDTRLPHLALRPVFSIILLPRSGIK